MKNRSFYIAWFVLYVITVVLGSVEPGNGLAKALMVLLAICFFVPPAALLYDGLRRGDRKQILMLRLISAASLALTFFLMLGNFQSLGASEGMGDVLYAVLIVVSAPMACMQYWAVSLFIWACLLTTTILYAPKKEK